MNGQSGIGVWARGKNVPFFFFWKKKYILGGNKSRGENWEYCWLVSLWDCFHITLCRLHLIFPVQSNEFYSINFLFDGWPVWSQSICVTVWLRGHNWNIRLDNVMTYWVTKWIRVLLEKLTVSQTLSYTKIIRFLCNPKAHYRINRSPQVVPILSQMNPIHTLQPSFP
jgi:hypothetical protein